MSYSYNARYSSGRNDAALGRTLPSSSVVAAAAAAAGRRSPSPVSRSSSTASSSSSSPFAYTSFVVAVGQRAGMSLNQAEKAVNFSTITGTSLVALRVLLYAFRSARGSGNGNGNSLEDEISDCTTPEDVITRRARTASGSLLDIFRRTLRKILLDESTTTTYTSAAAAATATEPEESTTEGPLVAHQGSCHCESIQFTVLAPRGLTAQDGPGKIQFRHTRVRASNFRIHTGHEWLKTYYVYFPATGKKGAHAFCERCGVHILYAPSKSTPYLSINVRCLRDHGTTTKIKVTSTKDGISDGIPAVGQFDPIHNDQLSTISEVTQPFHFQMNNQYPDRHEQFLHRIPGDNMSLESSATGPSVEGAIEVPIKQFYATTSPSRTSRKSYAPQREPLLNPTPSTTTTTTASLTTTEADSSSSLYKDQINELEMMMPTSSLRGGAGASLGGIDDLSFTGGESVSLMDDASVTSAAHRVPAAGMRRKSSLRVSTSGSRSVGPARLDSHNSPPPRHPSVSSPETRNKMKYFMSKYNKQAKT